MAFIIQEIHGNITADGIQLLAGRQIVLEVQVIPALAEDGRSPCLLRFLNRLGDNLCQELVWVSIKRNRCTDCLEGMPQHVMGVTVAATRDHKTFAGIVHHLGLALLNKDFGSLLVTYIDILTVFHGKGFYNLIAFRSEYLTINHKVGAGLFLAAGKHSHAEDDAHHNGERHHLLHYI